MNDIEKTIKKMRDELKAADEQNGSAEMLAIVVTAMTVAAMLAFAISVHLLN